MNDEDEEFEPRVFDEKFHRGIPARRDPRRRNPIMKLGAIMNRNPLTKKGADGLREELQRLKSEDRPKIIAAIAEARAHGDLKENAEYHAAKEQQGFIETRISDIEQCLGAAQVIDPATLDAEGRVVFGATVSLARIDNDETVRYQVVGDLEANIGAGLVSVSSPLARALIGKEEGDSVSVDAPGGKIEYEIISVEYL